MRQVVFESIFEQRVSRYFHRPTVAGSPDRPDEATLINGQRKALAAFAVRQGNGVDYRAAIRGPVGRRRPAIVLQWPEVRGGILQIAGGSERAAGGGMQ